MKHVRLHKALGLQHAAAVTRKIHLIASFEQFLQRRHEVCHIPFGRRHHARVPGHDMITRK
jgi:hypothetical protein